MRRIMDPHQFKTWLSFLLLAAAIIVVFHVVSDLSSETSIIFRFLSTIFHVIAPFVWGFMLAYVLDIPREKIESLLEKIRHSLFERHKRGISVLLTYIAFVIVIILLFNLVFPQIHQGVMDFAAFLPSLVYVIEQFLIDLSENEAIPFFDFTAFVGNFSLDEMLSAFDMNNVATAFGTLMSFTNFVFRGALAIISSIYFLAEGERIKSFAVRVVKAASPKKFYEGFMKYGREINTYFKRYIFCQVLDAIILGTIMTIAMSIMGIGHAFALGPMLGFANLVPYFGSIVGTIVAILVIMITDGLQMGLIATVVLLILQQIDANYIFPRLLGGSMKIPPLLVIIGIAIGNAVYGILGMIMAIPIATVLRNVVEDILKHIESKEKDSQGGVK